MRGKGKDYQLGDKVSGITPAYAGKRGQKCRRRNREKDHPRLCGEKDFGTIFNRRSQGSPPPMRGKGRVILCKKVRRGITPAYAGKSFRENL